MAIKSVELREKRAKLVADARAILTKAEAEERDTNAEENAEYDRIMGEVDGLKKRVDQLERLESSEDEMDAPAERSGRPGTAEERRASAPTSEAEERAAYTGWVRTGRIGQALRASQNRASEVRDLVLGTDTAAGYLITPTQISQSIVTQCADYTFIRDLAHVERVTEAKSLGVRQLTARADDFDWTTEIASVTADTGLTMGRRDLTPNIMTKLVKASIRLLMASGDASSLINAQLAYKYGLTLEKACLTGDGSGKPLGVFTASSNGIATSRDLTSGTSGDFTADDLIGLKFNIKQPYLQGPKSSWILHRTIVLKIRKFKDSYGQYLWQPGLQAGSPDRLLDVPLRMSEWAPNTVSAGNYVAIIGNFEYYWIAEVVDLIIQRLVEKYADTNEVGFLARFFADGSPVLGEAFSRLKIAA
jgi:HK97 family phage major capsid protein